MRAMNGCIVHYNIISTCQSAATYEMAKCFWPRVCHTIESTEIDLYNGDHQSLIINVVTIAITDNTGGTINDIKDLLTC